MDPISAAALAALAGGVGGEAGRQAWAVLSALVRRPFGHGESDGAGSAPVVSSGEAELMALGQDPSGLDQAQALSTALAARAVLDADFRGGLESWWQQAKRVRTDEGDVHNQISGGNQYGPVMQGRDFSGISFTTPAPSTAPRPTSSEAGTPQDE